MGKHSKPSKFKQNAAAAAAASVISVGALTATQDAAIAGPPGGWGPIIECESGGNPTAQNPSSSASGLFQFIDSTWAAYGGTEFAPRAKHATVEEQYIVAERVYADSGTAPWNASKSCWAGKTGEAKIKPSPVKRVQPPVESEVERTKPLPVVPPQAKPGPVFEDRTYEVRPGDTLTDIARAHGTTWQQVYEQNRDVVEHQDWIFPGEKLNI